MIITITKTSLSNTYNLSVPPLTSMMMTTMMMMTMLMRTMMMMMMMLMMIVYLGDGAAEHESYDWNLWHPLMAAR